MLVGRTRLVMARSAAGREEGETPPPGSSGSVVGGVGGSAPLVKRSVNVQSTSGSSAVSVTSACPCALPTA